VRFRITQSEEKGKKNTKIRGGKRGKGENHSHIALKKERKNFSCRPKKKKKGPSPRHPSPRGKKKKKVGKAHRLGILDREKRPWLGINKKRGKEICSNIS